MKNIKKAHIRYIALCAFRASGIAFVMFVGIFFMIIKDENPNKFTKISNEVARDKKLSMQAKGLLLVLLSLPPDWKIYQTQIREYCSNGRDAVMKAFKELITAKFISKKRIIDENMRFVKWEYTVYPVRQISPITEKPLTENPITENQALIKKETTKKENTKEILKHTQARSSFLKNGDNTAQQPTKKGKQPNRDNGKPKHTDSIEKRQNRLWAEVVAASKHVSTNNESATAFYEHYTATAVDDANLMRFEGDRFWNTQKRLDKWMKLEKPEYE